MALELQRLAATTILNTAYISSHEVELPLTTPPTSYLPVLRTLPYLASAVMALRARPRSVHPSRQKVKNLFMAEKLLSICKQVGAGDQVCYKVYCKV
jgi:hypothetical protein